MSEGIRIELDRVRELNERLEADLSRVNGAGDAPAPGEKGLAGLDIGRSVCSLLAPDTASYADSQDGNTPLVADSNGTMPAPQSDTSILPIVTSQRDRFRQRNAELEDELRKQFEIVTDLRTEIKSLQADNLKLYEKVRYINSYRDGAPPGSSGMALSGAGGSNGLQGVMGRRDEEMGRYKDKYEESMNPFEAFKGRVSPDHWQMRGSRTDV